MNLDELLKSIRDEGKKESSLTVKPRSFESSDEKLVEETIDPDSAKSTGNRFYRRLNVW